MNIRQTIAKWELGIQAYGTSDGASKGWDSRGRGRAKKNFEPPSSVVKNYQTHDYKKQSEEFKKQHGNIGTPESLVSGHKIGDVVHNRVGRVGKITRLDYRTKGNVLMDSKDGVWTAHESELEKHNGPLPENRTIGRQLD